MAVGVAGCCVVHLHFAPLDNGAVQLFPCTLGVGRRSKCHKTKTLRAALVEDNLNVQYGAVFAKHLPEIRVAEAERDVGDVQPLRRQVFVAHVGRYHGRAHHVLCVAAANGRGGRCGKRADDPAVGLGNHAVAVAGVDKRRLAVKGCRQRGCFECGYRILVLLITCCAK